MFLDASDFSIVTVPTVLCLDILAITFQVHTRREQTGVFAKRRKRSDFARRVLEGKRKEKKRYVHGCSTSSQTCRGTCISSCLFQPKREAATMMAWEPGSATIAIVVPWILVTSPIICLDFASLCLTLPPSPYFSPYCLRGGLEKSRYIRQYLAPRSDKQCLGE